MDECTELHQSTTTESSEEFSEAPPMMGRLTVTSKTSGRMLVGSEMRTWAEISRINFLEIPPESINSRQNSVRLRSYDIACKELGSTAKLLPENVKKTTEDIITEEFPHNVTPLMNEEQLWGCFYNFPELYDDMYSPTVRILKLRDVADLVGGVLTRDMVAACLTYLHRIPILEDYVYIKLNLSAKQLLNIDVLEHYKYLVYLDLSSNLLTDLSVLSNLLYLQYLSVAFNRLETVLDYKTPQWFLTEVYYRYNSVKKIRNLTMFWSITILDLSHNNIKSISGLENLRYLRRLDLSFNHIQRVENLNHLRLLWLDLSYNNISSFELGPNAGLWTMLHLEYLNLNENNLRSLKMFSGCTRFHELHLRNNRLSALLELAVYMRQMRRLCILDLRANPICSAVGYEDVIFDTFPHLLNLDATEIDPVRQRSSKMDTLPDVNTFACRRLLRMLYVEQLSRARVSVTPPADTEEVPLVVFVGEEGVGKGTLARRLATECSSKIQLARLHTTATYHFPDHYIEVSAHKFDDMLLAGEFLSYSEMGGNSYGLSREEAFISDGKVRVCCMDLVGALMLKMRGRRPYLILTVCHDQMALAQRQCQRKTRLIKQARSLVPFVTQLQKKLTAHVLYFIDEFLNSDGLGLVGARDNEYERRMSTEPLHIQSTLQVLLSGRIIITGILNEILLSLPDEKDKSEFALDSECSLLMDSDIRKAARNYARGADLLSLLTFNTSNSSVSDKQSRRTSQTDHSLYSIYKRSQGSSSGVAGSHTGTNISCEDRKNGAKKKEDAPASHSSPPRKPEGSDISASGQRIITNNQQNRISSTWRAYYSTKSSKSVTFTGPDVTGLEIEPPAETPREEGKTPGKSISSKLPVPELTSPTIKAAYDSNPEDVDLWLAFLTETGVIQTSQSGTLDIVQRKDTKLEDPESILKQLNFYKKTPAETVTTTLRDDYEGIHLLSPGLFHDTIAMDDPKEAFEKAKRIIRDIVNSQSGLGPMFDIDFARNLDYYPTVQQRLDDIRKEIAPRQIFY